MSRDSALPPKDCFGTKEVSSLSTLQRATVNIASLPELDMRGELHVDEFREVGRTAGPRLVTQSIAVAVGCYVRHVINDLSDVFGASFQVCLFRFASAYCIFARTQAPALSV